MEGDKDAFLTERDIACIEQLESPMLRHTAKQHLIAYNIEIASRQELLRRQQATHAAKYTRILCATYEHIKACIAMTPDTTKPFIVTVRGAQSTASRPTVESWCRINRGKSDALKLIADEMRSIDYTVTLYLSDDVFYVSDDHYYSGGERLTMQCIPNPVNTPTTNTQ